MKATVLLVTYNHAPYIAQALDSVLAQITDFPFEIIVSEDCSTDGTREIIEGYRRRHPAQIRLLLSERNRCDNEVIARGIRAARGDVIAYLDGDDWWTAPHKLQAQVAFLEREPGCAMCYHSVLRVYEGDERDSHPSLPPGPRRPMTTEDVLVRYHVNSCSLAFRRGAVPELPDWYRSADLADWALAVLVSTRGDLGYLDEVMAAYRIHSSGVWSALTHIQRIERRLKFYERLGSDIRCTYATAIRTGRAQTYFDLALGWEAQGHAGRAAACLLRSLRECPRNRHLTGTARLRVLARLWAPRLRAGVRALRGRHG
ncbi:MAG: glycosyltransferase [Gemmatimonadales bacterium]|nr:glycosyltransferase [Gemmatimonadales bacterium]